MSNGATTERMEVERITRSPDEIKETRRELAISTRTGVLMPVDLAQALEFAQNMAKAETAVPKHLRGSPGACLAILEYAGSWEMAPYGVANKSYVVNDRLCFESQLIHAVIKKRADLKYPKLGLETEYLGEGATRQVRIFAECYIDDERTVTRVLEITTPTFKDIQPKNSPLWTSNPDQQLFYRGALLWQRRHKPEILLGIYTRDEMQDMTPEDRAALAQDRGAAEVVGSRTSGLAQRLKGGDGEGFHPDNVNGISGQERVAGPIIDHNELANIAADVADGQQQPTESAPNDRQGAEPPASEGKPSAPAANDLFDPQAGTKKAEPQADAPKGPANDEEYQQHLRVWLVAESDPAAITTRYSSESKLRTECKADLKACKALKNARLEALGAPT